jgi:hypothetical protein
LTTFTTEFTMEKKSAQIQISENKSKGEQLSKEQVAFNKLTERIAKGRAKIEKRTAILETLLELHGKDYKKAEDEKAYAYIKLAQTLDAAVTLKTSLKKNYLEKIGNHISFLLQWACGHIEPTKEVIALHDKYSSMTHEEILKDEKEEAIDSMAMMFSMMYEQEFLPEEFEETPEAIERLRLKLEAAKATQAEREARRSKGEHYNPFVDDPFSDKKKKKSKKQIERELKQAALDKEKEELEQKSVRGIYIELAKVLHPDAEMNEEEKLWKQELMKEVNLAYEAKNLFKLLELEMTWLSKQNNYLADMPLQKLKTYNSMLQDQAAKLEFEYFMLDRDPRFSDVIEYVGMTLAASKKQLASGVLSIRNEASEVTELENSVISKDIKINNELLEYLDEILPTNDHQDPFGFWDF